MSGLEVMKKSYPKLYELYNKGNDECKKIAINIYYHNYDTTFNEDVVDYCKNIGFNVYNDKENEGLYYIKY